MDFAKFRNSKVKKIKFKLNRFSDIIFVGVAKKKN